MPAPLTLRPLLVCLSALLFNSACYSAEALTIGTIPLRMDPTDGAVLLRKDVRDKSSFAVTLIDGERQLSGRVKTSGSSSRSRAKRSLYVKLDKPGKWQGQSRISLNGMGSDSTQMRNRIVWDIYHELGLVGPKTSYQRVTLNGQPQGLYLQIEWVEGKMFEKAGLGGDGELYHVQDSNFCGDLTKNNGYDIDDCWYKFSPPFDDFTSLQELINNIDATPINQFDRFMADNFEVESILNWFAVNVLVANGDTYNKNYFLYRAKATGKWTVIPWDYDLTFGRTFDSYLDYPENIFNDRFEYFYPPELGAYNPLKEKFLRNPVLLARFKARLAHLMGMQKEEGKPGFGLFTPATMSARIASLKAALLPEVQQDPYLRGEQDSFFENVDALEHFVLARTGYLKTAIFGGIPWNPELAYWRPQLSPRPLPYPEKLQALADGTGSVAVVADGYGYLLAVMRATDPAQPFTLAAEAQLGQPPTLLPPGVDARNCIQRTWYVTLRASAPLVRGALTLEYLQENSVLHELGTVRDERALKLWRLEQGQWKMVPARVNTLANTLTTSGLEITPERTMRFVACTADAQTAGKSQ